MAGETILLVEDNPLNLQLTSHILKKLGYKVLEATDGEEGITKARSGSIHLILLDIQLPGIDGFEVARILMEDPATRAIPIIAVTAHAMRGDMEKALQVGFKGYITKPIDVSKFPEQVAAYLRDAK